MLLPGENELADKLLSLVKTARQQEATIPEQGKVLHEMGKLYLKDAIETGNGEQFVKASALINAALVRSEHENDQNILRGLIKQIYQCFIKSIKNAAPGPSMDDLVIKTRENQKYLCNLRQEVYTMSEEMEHLFSIYSVYKVEPMVEKLRKPLQKEFLENVECLIQTESTKRREILVMQMFGVEEKAKARHMVKQLFEIESVEELISLIGQFLQQKKREINMKTEVDDKQKALYTIFHTFQYENYHIDYEERLVKEVQKISGQVQSKIVDFVKSLWDQAILMCPVPPPCQYAVIGLGSLARQEITPYSDLEFALLIETDSKENKQYFKNLVRLFHLLILDLGETPIPTVAIESLNDYYSTPGGDRFYDRVTPRGFRLDGAMPWACKTPLGRKDTPQKEALDLIKTPEDMAALQMEENSLGQAYHVADILCSYIFVCGSSPLFGKYKDLHIKVIAKTNFKKRAKYTLIGDYKRSPDLTWNSYNTLVVKNKTDYYRFTSTFVENLRMYFTPTYQPESVWKVLDHLKRVSILSWEGAYNLRVLLAICYGFRLLTYFKNHGQYENVLFMRTNKATQQEREQYSPNKRNKCYVALLSNSEPMLRLEAGIEAIKCVIEKYFMNKGHGSVQDLRRERFVQLLEYSQKSSSWTRHGTTLANLKWARTSKELPPKTCGEKCLEPVLIFITHITEEAKLLEYIDELLTRRECKCLLLVRRNLLVSKAILIQRYSLIGEVPKEANVLALQESYRQKKYKNVRERYNLLMDMGQLAILTTDRKLKLSVAEDITSFLKEVATFEDSQQKIVNLLESYLLKTSIKLYSDTEKLEKGVMLCEQQIEEYEKEWGHDNYSVRLGYWYLDMGGLKYCCGLLVESLYYVQKAFDIFLFVWEQNPENDELMHEPRSTAYSLAKLHKAQGKVEDAIKVLEKVFTKDGKIYCIVTDVDYYGVTLLLQYLGKENNGHFDELLEILLKRSSSPQLRPDTILCIVEMILLQISYLGYENCHKDKKNKGDLLIEILIKLLDNELLHKFLLSRSQLDLDLPPHPYCPSPDLCIWIGYFFKLCDLAVLHFDPINFKGCMTILQQAEIFCEKVVKNCATNTIYNMCLVYVEYKRNRFLLYYNLYMYDDPGAIEVLVKFPLLNKKICQFFPKCHKADLATDKLVLLKKLNINHISDG